MKRRPQSLVGRGRHRTASHAEPATGLRELVTYLAKGLVDEPSAVAVSEVKRENEAVFELRVAPGDLGNVIGRNGRTAKAMRTLMAAGAPPGCDPFLDILD